MVSTDSSPRNTCPGTLIKIFTPKMIENFLNEVNDGKKVLRKVALLYNWICTYSALQFGYFEVNFPNFQTAMFNNSEQLLRQTTKTHNDNKATSTNVQILSFHKPQCYLSNDTCIQIYFYSTTWNGNKTFFRVNCPYIESKKRLIKCNEQLIQYNV